MKICTAVFSSVVALVLTVSNTQAQSVEWTQRFVNGPSPRAAHAMAYDAARDVTVLFGGGLNPSGNANGETWEWNGTLWTQRTVSGPSPRQWHAMAYDSARGVTVLFGGWTGSVYSDETWEWNGTAWIQRMVGGPAGRESAGLAYDSARGVTVLFGGGIGGSTVGDMWEWNGTAWTQRMVNGPSPRYQQAMAYDSARGVTVLFGGAGSGCIETWEWNGTAWSQRMVSGPSCRSGHEMAFDIAHGVTVLFGGYLDGDTWEWNGTAWTQRMVNGPSPRYQHAMAYDSVRGVTLLFGGYNGTNNGRNGETWQLGTLCGAPSITSQPAAQSVCPSGSARFMNAAAGIGPFSYQWQIQTAPPPFDTWQTLGNAPIPLPCGGSAFATPINSPSASIGVRPCSGGAGASQHFQIRCLVSDACGGSVTSNEAIYTICPADFNCSGGVNVQDIFAFLAAWFAGDPHADFNGVNGITVTDIFNFLEAWFVGC